MNIKHMRRLFPVVALAIFAEREMTAAPITDVALSHPGFDSPVLPPGPATGAVTPAAAFAVAMTDAFLDSDGITLRSGGTSARSSRMAPGTRSNPDGRRVRSIIGAVPGGSSSTGLFVPSVGGLVPVSTGGGGGASIIPVPEPGTALTGLLLLGVCAMGTRGRRERGALAK